MRETLHKSELLRGRNVFQEVFEKGSARAGKHVRCLILERVRGERRHSSLLVGFVVRRKIPRAVDRNRYKRLLREAYRKHKFILQSALKVSSRPLSVVFMYAPSGSGLAKEATYATIEREMKELLTSIAQSYSA